MRMAMGMEVPRNQGRKSGKHQKAPPEGWPAPGRLLPLALGAIILLGIGPARQALAWGRMGHRASTRLAETRLTPKARATHPGTARAWRVAGRCLDLGR